MKKFLFLLAAALLLLGNTACSNDDDTLTFTDQMVSVANSSAGCVYSVNNYNYILNLSDKTIQITGSVKLPDGSTSTFFTPEIKMTQQGEIYKFSTSQVSGSSVSLSNLSGTLDLSITKFYITFDAGGSTVWATNGLSYAYGTSITTDTVAGTAPVTDNTAFTSFSLDASKNTADVFIARSTNGDINNIFYDSRNQPLAVQVNPDGFSFSADSMQMVTSFGSGSTTIYGLRATVSNAGRNLVMSYRLGNTKVAVTGRMFADGTL